MANSSCLGLNGVATPAGESWVGWITSAGHVVRIWGMRKDKRPEDYRACWPETPAAA